MVKKQIRPVRQMLEKYFEQKYDFRTYIDHIPTSDAKLIQQYRMMLYIQIMYIQCKMIYTYIHID